MRFHPHIQNGRTNIYCVKLDSVAKLNLINTTDNRVILDFAGSGVTNTTMYYPDTIKKFLYLFGFCRMGVPL